MTSLRLFNSSNDSAPSTAAPVCPPGTRLTLAEFYALPTETRRAMFPTAPEFARDLAEKRVQVQGRESAS